MKLNDFVFFPGLIMEALGILVLVTGILTGTAVLLYIGAGLLCAAVVVHTVRIIRRSFDIADPGPEVPAGITTPGNREDSRVLYSDSLIAVAGDSITFYHYSFPFFSRARIVPFSEIDHIDVKKPPILTGKWRIGGSGSLTIWFPLDAQRPSRDRIYHVFLKTRGMKIGFTVEHPIEVTAILKKKGLIGSDDVSP